jgi:glycosyltransferase involved in cell wall biosynthesis
MPGDDPFRKSGSRRRPLVYDVTQLSVRLNAGAVTGIDWVDRAYAHHLSSRGRIAVGSHYGLFAPHFFSTRYVGKLSHWHETQFREGAAADGDFAALRSWLVGEKSSARGAQTTAARPLGLGAVALSWLREKRWASPPEGSIYLNVSQFGFEHRRFFSWLDWRSDVLPVFFLHDLLPLDHPAFFREGYEAVFRARLATMRRARALIVASEETSARLRREWGADAPPILTRPLPSPLADAPRWSKDAALAATPYFVVVSTIEPRKNHMTLIDAWRRLSREMAQPPRLVCVGRAGWRCDDIMKAFDDENLRASVRLVPNLSSAALRHLVAHARALLSPSLAEGYGIPPIEAMTLGVPAICSDIPIFRETTQGCATYLPASDAGAWASAARNFSDAGGATQSAARALVTQFQPPGWDRYFQDVEAFLDAL